MKRFVCNSKIVIKLGTKAIFDSVDNKIKRGVIRSLARDVSELLKKKNDVVIVSSGAVGCGMHVIKGGGDIGIKQARAAVGQIGLMAEYSKIFAKFDLHVAQFLLNSNDLRSKRLSNIKMAHKCLGKKVVPIINENDVTTTNELSFGDNDCLASEILEKFDFDVLLILTDLGSLVRDGKKMQESDKFNVGDYDNLSVSDGFGFGGLKSKLDVAKGVVGKGKSFIIGKAGDSIVDILKRKESATWFVRG